MSPKLRRIWIQLTADRKRFGILCAMVALGLLLWGRLIVVSNLPRTAVAEPQGNAPAKPGTASSRSTSANAVNARAPLAITLSDSPQRDPFVISPKYFPRPTPPAGASVDGSKLIVKPAEDAVQQEARVLAQLRALAAKFRLEAAMTGSMAVINGTAYRTGDDVKAVDDGRTTFKLIEIRQRSVVLKCEGQLFEIQMASPRD